MTDNLQQVHDDWKTKGFPYYPTNQKWRDEIFNQLDGKKIDLVVGGPPCQGFSIFGKRRFKNTKKYNPLDDDRNDLVKTYFEYIEKIKPQWIIMENVNGILNLGGGIYIDFIKLL